MGSCLSSFVSFAAQKPFSFMRSHLSTLWAVFYAIGILFRKSLPILYLELFSLGLYINFFGFSVTKLPYRDVQREEGLTWAHGFRAVQYNPEWRA